MIVSLRATSSGGAIEREILWRLINGEQGAMVRQLGLADSRMTQIRWILDHYAESGSGSWRIWPA